MEISHRVTLRDIAKELGVSHVTVSLALRNHPRISAEVRKKVHDTALSMGYRPDPMLAALSHYRRSKAEVKVEAAVGWINAWPKPSDLRQYKEFDAYWKGASTCAEKFGYYLEEFAFSQMKNVKRLETVLKTRNIKGILLPPIPSSAHEVLQGLDWSKFACIRLGRSLDWPKSHIVTSDQTYNAMLAFQQILAKGYKKIGFVGPNATNRLFSAGYLLEQTQIDPQNAIPPLLLSPKALLSPKTEVLRWMQEYQPDAILTELAQLPDILLEAKYRIPQDVALAGLSLLDGHINAGIDQQSIEIGRIAMLAIVNQINEYAYGSPEIAHQTLIPGFWVDGTSMPKASARQS